MHTLWHLCGPVPYGRVESVTPLAGNRPAPVFRRMVVAMEQWQRVSIPMSRQAIPRVLVSSLSAR